MQMVREQDRLDAVAHSRERFETVAGAGIVEAGENVVADERRRIGAGGVVLGVGKAERQIELVARAFAQMRDRRPFAVRPASLELRLVIVIETLVDPGKGAARQGRERFPGARHQRVAARRAMVVERAADERRRRLQDRPAPGGVDELGFRVAALLQRRLGADAALELLPPALQPITFRVALFFLRSEFFIPALEFVYSRRGGVRIERGHLLDEARFVDPSARSARRMRCWRSASATRVALALAREQCGGSGARGQRGGHRRQGLLGPAPAGAGFVKRS